MPTIKGFVFSLQVRSDGWVEVEILSPHAGNARRTCFLQGLDGAPGQTNRRLSQTGLLRDAMARSLPVEIETRNDGEFGEVIEDVSVLPRASLAGRAPTQRVVGIVIGLGVVEVGPGSSASPYLDPPDLGSVTLLADDGSVLQALLDLQRPDPLMARQSLALLTQAQRTRRPVALTLGLRSVGAGKEEPRQVAAGVGRGVPAVLAVEYEAVPVAELSETYAFIERLTQRHESWQPNEATALSQVHVQYTSAPAQTPEGDVSDNGGFAPVSGVAWVHGDSPMLASLNQALRERLMVRLGLQEDQVHEVVLVAPMGSAARPVWVEMRKRLLPTGAGPLCDNVPTVQGPGAGAFADLPLSVSWVGHGYFAPGLWRFVIVMAAQARLTIDCKAPCVDEPDPRCGGTPPPAEAPPCCTPRAGDERQRVQHHAYLGGMHRVEVMLTGHACHAPFELRAYRIR
jgi:hypothetical protein